MERHSAGDTQTPGAVLDWRPFAAMLFAIAVLRTAWLCDDAFITLRTVDNFVAGLGLRWNVAERVQAFTHPLWLFLLAIPYSFTREPYFGTLMLSIALSLGAFWILIARVAASAVAGAVAAFVLIFSKAFVEYSTSGLENPASHFLLALWFLLQPVGARDRRLRAQFVVAGLLVLNRLDLVLLLLPALVEAGHAAGRRRFIGAAAWGVLPVAAWHVWSVVYFGFPFPNTAYAKLSPSIGSGPLLVQGVLYFFDSAAQDPVTLLAICGALIASMAVAPRQSWPFALGVVLYLAYVVRIGGDFMTGRFLAAPLLCAIATLVRVEWRLEPRVELASVSMSCAALAFLGFFATTRPPLTSDQNTFIMAVDQGLGVGGVADERSFYYRYTGLLRWSRDLPLPHNAEEQWGREAAAAPGVVVHPNAGLFGFYAGPRVRIVDTYALGDVLLARLPPKPGWRIGHFEREVPEGYVQSLETGHNLIKDIRIAMRYERLKLIAEGPLWSRRRWRAIVAENLGRP